MLAVVFADVFGCVLCERVCGLWLIVGLFVCLCACLVV